MQLIAQLVITALAAGRTWRGGGMVPTCLCQNPSMRISLATFCSLALLLGCTDRATNDKAAAPDKAEAPPPPEAAEPSAGPTDPSFALMQKVCASPCTGGFARVAVFRDSDGQVARLRYDGDIDSCSHPPRIYFDGEGTQTLHVAMRPVEAGSDEAKQAEQIQGLVESETLSCFDADRCTPARSEGSRSAFACRSDSDCVGCECAPVNRAEWERRGGADACTIDGEECIATNPACCDGKCVMAR